MVYPKAVPLQPFHIGEELIARMLTDIASRDLLGDVHCELTGRTLLTDFSDCGLLDGFELHPDSASVRMSTTEGDFDCDGAQTVDILCTQASVWPSRSKQNSATRGWDRTISDNDSVCLVRFHVTRIGGCVEI